MAKKADFIVPSWLGQVEFRIYKNRRDFFESVGLRWIVNEPHFETMRQLEKFYIVEQEQGKHSFVVLGFTELGIKMLEVKEKLEANDFGSRIIFQ